MKRIVFRGYLADMYPDGIQVEGDSAAECLSALQMFPGFRESDGVKHTVVLPHFGSRDALYEKTLHSEIHVAPVVLGAGGKGSFLLIAVGIFLIATGWGAPAGATVLGGTMLATTAVSIGVVLVLNGVIGLLSPQPELNSSAGGGEERSNYLAANRNTARAGTRIPLLFGRRRVWGHFLSFNVSTGNKPAAVAPPRVDLPPETLTFEADSEFQILSDGP